MDCASRSKGNRIQDVRQSKNPESVFAWVGLLWQNVPEDFTCTVRSDIFCYRVAKHFLVVLPIPGE